MGVFQNNLMGAAAAAASAGGADFYDYQIANSYRSMAGVGYFSRTPSCAWNRKTYTINTSEEAFKEEKKNQYRERVGNKI